MSKIEDKEDREILKTAEDRKRTYTSKLSDMAPAGYLPITLSSEGSFGVPKKIYIQNFTTEDALYLSMASEELLPEFLIPILNKNIWSGKNEINVATWTEPQIVELLVKVYSNFFSSYIEDIQFPIEEEDEDYINKSDNEAMKKSFESGWKPTVTLDLNKLNFYDLKDITVKEHIRIKKEGVDVLFSIPRFGDILVIKKIIDDKYKASDEKYKKMNKRYEELSSEEVLELERYYVEKSMFISKITKSYYLQALNGKDLKDVSLLDKVETYGSDGRLDISIMKRYEKAITELKYGINPELEVMNPFTNKTCTRRFVFRPFNLLQIILLSESDEYDISYE